MDILTFLYTISGLVFGAAFIPQVMTLLNDKSGAASLNLWSWGMFTLCSVITLSYAISNNGDYYFIVCSAIGTCGNLSVLMLGIFRRVKLAALAMPVRQQF